MNYRPGQQGVSPIPRRGDRTPPAPVMIAGLCALFGGLIGLVFVQMGFAGLRTVEALRDPKLDVDWDVMQLENRLEVLVGAVFVVTQGLGGALLLARRSTGLTMVTIGTGLGVFVWLGGLVVEDDLLVQAYYLGFAMTSLVPLVAALLPATNRWVEAGRPTPTTYLAAPPPR